MLDFNFHVDLEAADDRLVAAVAAVTGQSDVRVLGSWWGSEKDTMEISREETGAVNIEWYMRKGRFALDVRVSGPGLNRRETEARVTRALAVKLGRSILFSDCGVFPFGYFMADPDGAIWFVVTTCYGDDDDVMDLLPDDPADPNHFAPELITPAGAPLPLRPTEQPLDSADNLQKAFKARCDTDAPGLICESFWGRCPKRQA